MYASLFCCHVTGAMATPLPLNLIKMHFTCMFLIQHILFCHRLNFFVNCRRNLLSFYVELGKNKIKQIMNLNSFSKPILEIPFKCRLGNI